MKKNRPKHSLGAWCLLLGLLLVGCQNGASDPNITPEAHFLPPTNDPSAPQNAAPQPTPFPTRQANCENQLVFLDDLTIPDGTEVLPGEKVAKRWLITNEGSCNWDQSYSLQLISGLSLGADKIQQLYPARQTSEAVLEIIFTAPDNPGRYNSWWQAYDQDDNRFGDPVYMEISVVEELSEDG
ncbi:MAG: NBR1-Ig-like domain-containing protein [Anaerolineales bacterium]|nr:NBR1-Ig-like domain-containing protein [Anaerolineales bacterium]